MRRAFAVVPSTFRFRQQQKSSIRPDLGRDLLSAMPRSQRDPERRRRVPTGRNKGKNLHPVVILQRGFLILAIAIAGYEAHSAAGISGTAVGWPNRRRRNSAPDVGDLRPPILVNLPSYEPVGMPVTREVPEATRTYSAADEEIEPKTEEKAVEPSEPHIFVWGEGSGAHAPPPLSWYEQAAASMSSAVNATSDAASAAWAEAADYARRIQVSSSGFILLPSLTKGTTMDNAIGAAWSAQARNANVSALPAHLKAVALHAPPRLTPEAEEAASDERGSIFSARRKGDWMGCNRQNYLVCKGVYRAIKQANAITVMDVACDANAEWLPKVVRHLRREFRMIKLVCANPSPDKLEPAKADYMGVDLVTFTTFDPFVSHFTDKCDLIIAVNLLKSETLIRAMRFFKHLEASSDNIGAVVFDNYPDSTNRLSIGKKSVKVNAFAPPFLFGRTLSRYAKVDEQAGAEIMEIVSVATKGMFEFQTTPSMAELEDPKLRRRKSDPLA
jgi:hypothetical protein